MLILVSIQKYHAFLPIGWYEDEIRVKTEVYIDVEISYHTEYLNDNLANTLDYSDIHKIIKNLSIRSFKLLESFGEAFLGEISERYGHLDLKGQMIRIHKSQILESGSACDGQYIEMRT